MHRSLQELPNFDFRNLNQLENRWNVFKQYAHSRNMTSLHGLQYFWDICSNSRHCVFSFVATVMFLTNSTAIRQQHQVQVQIFKLDVLLTITLKLRNQTEPRNGMRTPSNSTKTTRAATRSVFDTSILEKNFNVALDARSEAFWFIDPIRAIQPKAFVIRSQTLTLSTDDILVTKLYLYQVWQIQYSCGVRTFTSNSEITVSKVTRIQTLTIKLSYCAISATAMNTATLPNGTCRSLAASNLGTWVVNKTTYALLWEDQPKYKHI